jgi:hypothetical protein
MDGRGKNNGDRYFMILSIQKYSASFTSYQALKIHKYRHPGYFCMGIATNPRTIQTKELHILLSSSFSGRLAQQRNADVVVHTCYVTLFCCVKVTSCHHVMMHRERSMIHLRGLLTKPPEFAARTVVPSINYPCIRRARGLSIRKNKKWCLRMYVTYQCASLAILNPPISCKVGRLSTIESIVITSMVTEGKGDHELTGFLSNLK